MATALEVEAAALGATTTVDRDAEGVVVEKTTEDTTCTDIVENDPDTIMVLLEGALGRDVVLEAILELESVEVDEVDNVEVVKVVVLILTEDEYDVAGTVMIVSEIAPSEILNREHNVPELEAGVVAVVEVVIGSGAMTVEDVEPASDVGLTVVEAIEVIVDTSVELEATTLAMVVALET